MEAATTSASLAAKNVRIFMSFDPENDEDLRDLLVEQSSRRNSGFEMGSVTRPRSS
jgi:hypothetical protein